MFIMKFREVRKQVNRENCLYRKCVPAESGNELLPSSADWIDLKKVQHFVKMSLGKYCRCAVLLYQPLRFKGKQKSGNASDHAAGLCSDLPKGI